MEISPRNARPSSGNLLPPRMALPSRASSIETDSQDLHWFEEVVRDQTRLIIGAGISKGHAEVGAREPLEFARGPAFQDPAVPEMHVTSNAFTRGGVN